MMTEDQMQHIAREIFNNTKSGVDIWAEKLLKASEAGDLEACKKASQQLEGFVSQLLILLKNIT